MPVTIKEVFTGRGLKNFIKFPEKLYRNHPNWVNPLREDEYNTLHKKKNPAFEFCSARYFIAYKEGKAVGRVAAIVNRNANRDWNENYMRFGWLDFIDDIEVLRALMKKVEELAREQGLEAINGPFGFTDMDREGLLVEGFENKGSFTTLYNFPYYGEYLEQLGYLPDADWRQREYDVPEAVPEKLKQFSRIVKEKYGVRVLEKVSRKRLRKYATGMFRTLNRSFRPLYGFTPLSDKQVEMYINQFLPLINFDLICLVIDKEENVVGFAVTMPSLSDAVKRAKGRLFPFGIFHLLFALKKYEVIDMLMIGIDPAYQNKGINALIFDHLNSNFIKLGVKRVIANPQLDSNFAVKKIFEYYPGRPYMTRRCYLKKLNQV
jgi:hypothetical protein